MQCAVGSYQAVAIEIVIRCRITSVITAVGKDFLPVLIKVAQALVNEIPNKSSLIIRIFANQIPVLFEIAHTVTHRMRIFALDQRLRQFCFEISLVSIRALIHRTINVGISHLEVTFICIMVVSEAGTFILNETRGVECLDMLVGIFKIDTHTCFITQTPNYNGGMVFVDKNIIVLAFNMCLSP